MTAEIDEWLRFDDIAVAARYAHVSEHEHPAN